MGLRSTTEPVAKSVRRLIRDGGAKPILLRATSADLESHRFCVGPVLAQR
jgi:hypothetical protein